MMSVPLALFSTDKSMRKGNKSDLVTCIHAGTNVQPTSSIPLLDKKKSHSVVDGMGLVYKIPTKFMNTFLDFTKEYCSAVYKLPGSRTYVDFDRYDRPSIKDSTRRGRASSKKSERKQKCKPVAKIVSPEVNLPQGGDFKSFLSINDNKIALQQLLGEALIEHAPHDGCI